MNGFCEKKFRSMLISGTFTKAVMYLMLLSDSIIAGYFSSSFAGSTRDAWCGNHMYVGTSYAVPYTDGGTDFVYRY